MGLNSESPFVGDKAIEEAAGIVSPNVLRAVEVPKRPDPTGAPVVEERATVVVELGETDKQE